MMDNLPELTAEYPDFHFEYRGAQCLIRLQRDRQIVNNEVRYALDNRIEYAGRSVGVYADGRYYNVRNTQRRLIEFEPSVVKEGWFFKPKWRWEHTPEEHLAMCVKAMMKVVDEFVDDHNEHLTYFKRLAKKS